MLNECQREEREREQQRTNEVREQGRTRQRARDTEVLCVLLIPLQFLLRVSYPKQHSNRFFRGQSFGYFWPCFRVFTSEMSATALVHWS